MKGFVLLLVTFLGICKCPAQFSLVKDTLVAQKISNNLIIKEKAAINLYPNPSKNKATLTVKGFEPGLVLLQILSNYGKIIRTENRFLFSGNENVMMMFSLTPGVYFVSIKQKENVVKKRMLVQ